MKLIWPCRYSTTSLDRWRAIAAKPIASNRLANVRVSCAVYSTNSNPSVPAGLACGSMRRLLAHDPRDDPGDEDPIPGPSQGRYSTERQQTVSCLMITVR